MIYIEVLDRYWNAGKSTLKNLSEEELNDFHRWLANQYKFIVVKAIDDQRYRNKWPELTIGYFNYKKNKGFSTGMWEMTGELKSALRVRKVRGIQHVGFPKKKHSNTTLYYADLARVLEYGNIRIPPRPLFRKVYIYMSANINYFYNKYLREVSE